ncbi:SDR family NAD(P)-dependent oxidoreductase [Salininema proteolyticum]|uniref:SDR family NAD(P)-dependent oxidoreductase n=1 Tax=Salininema proteolyticum TaxID=1607685 RepID=A0ABV8TZS0_9ACTN
MKSLRGQKIAVTGGAGGIGFAVAEAAVARGASTVLLGRTESALDEAVERLGPSASLLAVDVTDAGAVAEAFAAIGPLDHLAACAYESYAGPFAELDRERVRSFVETKLWGQYNCAASALPHLSPTGSVVLFSGFLNRRGKPGTVPFAIANGAVEGLVRGLALDIAPVRANAVSPGQIDTFADRMSPERHEEYLAEAAGANALGRPGTPAEAAHAALFLMENSHMTGAVVDVDGARL